MSVFNEEYDLSEQNDDLRDHVSREAFSALREKLSKLKADFEELQRKVDGARPVGIGNIRESDLDPLVQSKLLAKLIAGTGLIGGGVPGGRELTLAADKETLYGAVAVRTYRNLAAYMNAGWPSTGTIKITLPYSWTSTMLDIVIRGYLYHDGAGVGGPFEIHCAGYNEAGGSSWVDVKTEMLGTLQPATQVRYGHDGSKCCILIGATSSNWYNIQMEICDLLTGYNNLQSGWGSGWAISLITSEAGITVSGTNALLPCRPLPHSASTRYNVGDLCTYSDNIYVCILTHTGQTPAFPSTSYWRWCWSTKVNVSTSAASGTPANGDIWLQVES